MSQWRETTLGELITVKHGWAFKGEHFESEGDEIVLTPGNFPIGGGLQFREGKERYYSGEYPSEFRLAAGDLLVVMTDLKQDAPILGSPAFVPHSPTVLHNQRLGLVKIKDDQEVDRRFLYYVLLSDESRRQLRATATGATVRHTAPNRIYDVKIRLPSQAEQATIGDVLGSLDDLIANNQRRVELLAEMARAIYREWFVHFRYPGHEGVPLVESPQGPIPAGWAVSPLVDIAEITMGQSPRSEFYNLDGIGKPFHQGVADFGRHFPTHRKYCSIDARMARDGDVLVSVRAPVGRINLAHRELVIGRGLAAVRSRTGHPSLLLQTLKEIFDEEDSMGGGTIFNAIGKPEMEGLPTLVPSAPVARAGEDALAPIVGTIRRLTFAMRELTAIRDVLLPRLVSGAVDVSSLDLGMAGATA